MQPSNSLAAASPKRKRTVSDPSSPPIAFAPQLPHHRFPARTPSPSSASNTAVRAESPRSFIANRLEELALRPAGGASSSSSSPPSSSSSPSSFLPAPPVVVVFGENTQDVKRPRVDSTDCGDQRDPSVLAARGLPPRSDLPGTPQRTASAAFPLTGSGSAAAAGATPGSWASSLAVRPLPDRVTLPAISTSTTTPTTSATSTTSTSTSTSTTFTSPSTTPFTTTATDADPKPSTDLVWHDDEITGHLGVDPDDDGYGINGIGFKPTPALAWHRSQRRKQQIVEWKAREAREARQKRARSRMASEDGGGGGPGGGVGRMVGRVRRVVRFA